MLLACACALPAQDPRPDGHWQPPPGWVVQVEAAGFDDPVAVAVVPRPGPGDDDARCFVAERSGRIKLVTDTGEVHEFAAAPFDARGGEQPPATRVEVLDLAFAPGRGFLFVAFREGAEGGPSTSSVARIRWQPGARAAAHSCQRRFEQLFRNRLGIARNVIRALAVRGDVLFVAVDNRGDPAGSRDLDCVAGKVLRMTLDGRPLPDNPFYTADGADTVRDYVWASGFRSPRGLTFAAAVLFAADRGLEFDRVLRVERGSDHGYDGTVASLATDAYAVFGGAAAIARIAFLPGGMVEPADGGPGENVLPVEAELHGSAQRGDAVWHAGAEKPPGIAGRLLLVQTRQGGWLERSAGVVLAMPLARETLAAAGPVAPFLVRVGEAAGSPSAIAMGSDAVHVATDGDTGGGVVLRIAAAGGAPAPVAAVENAQMLMAARACFSCHGGEAGGSVVPAPSLERDPLAARLMRRLHSEAYLTRLEAVDRLRGLPFETYAFARRDVRQATGMARVRTWLRYKLVEPCFDEPDAEMPDPGLTEEQAAAVVDELLRGLPETGELGVLDRMRLLMAHLVPHPRQRHLLLFLLAGCIAGGLLVLTFQAIRRRARPARPVA